MSYRGGQSQGGNEPAVLTPQNKKDIQEIMEKGTPQKLDQVAKALGQQLVDRRLTSAQIRNIFGTARRIQANWPFPSDKNKAQDSSDYLSKRTSVQRDLVLLKPKLAYQGKREPPVKHLEIWLSEMIDLTVPPVKDLEPEIELQRFTRFMDFFEATLAYFVAQGGDQKDSEGGRR